MTVSIKDVGPQENGKIREGSCLVFFFLANEYLYNDSSRGGVHHSQRTSMIRLINVNYIHPLLDSGKHNITKLIP